MKKTITAYLKTFEAGSAPTRSTVINRIRRKDINGEKIGGTWYIYPTINQEEQQLNAIIETMNKKALHYEHG